MTYYELYHWGIPQQKWGRRRYQNPDGTWTEEGKMRRRKSEPRQETNPKRMSDEELRKRIERLKLEKEYREVNKGSQSEGKKFVIEVLREIGKSTITNIGTQAATHALGTAINKLYKVGDIEDKDYEKKRIVNPQKGQTSGGK